jgi:signal recognition particle receptor subunit beta
MEDYDYLFKIVLIGNVDSGKSAILKNYAGTPNGDITPKIININGQITKLQIYDSAGHERFKKLNKTILEGAAMIYVYNMYNNTGDLQNTLKNYLSDIKDIPVKYLVGYNNGLVQCSSDDMSLAAEKFEMKYIELNVDDLASLNDLFEHIAKDCVQMLNQK